MENLVIIGSGPAGYTAGIYAGRASLRPLLFEGVQAGGTPGGQLMTTTEVENYPGFPEGITGPDLMDRMRKQAERWGAVLATEDVESVDLSVRPFVVRTSERTVRCHSVVVATGATAAKLGLPSEHTYWSRGISACAICDGASPLFKGADVAVVGGGDSACEEAVYLTKYASTVHLLVRGTRLRASAAMAYRALSNPRITTHFHTRPLDVVGDVKGRLAGIRVSCGPEGAGTEKLIEVKGVFYAVGHKPNSSFLAGQVALDERGYVKVDAHGATSVPGVFAAGDLHDTEWRQAITAAGSGCAAAISVERYLTNNYLVEEAPPAEASAASPAAAAAAPSRHAEPAHSGGGGGDGDGDGVGAEEEAATEVVKDRAAEEFDIEATRHAGQYALRKLYHESTRPLLVVYTSPTCGPCRRLKPMLAALGESYGGAVHVVEIDIERDPEIAEASDVTGTPTVQIFHRKQRLAVLPGVRMKTEYRAVLDNALGAGV